MHTGGVEAGDLGIGLVLVIGIAVVVYGWLGDRTDTKRRHAALTQPPDRPIPGLQADSAAPGYVTEFEALHRPADSNAALSSEERTALKQRLTGAPTMRHGHAAKEFATDPTSGLCVLDDPLVLVADTGITTIRELLPLLERTRAAHRTVVVVAPAISDEVLTTLRVNASMHTVAGAAVLLPDPGQRRSLASLVGALPLALDDLRSGYLPDSALGTCGTWVSNGEQLWILSELPGLDRLDRR